MSILVVIPARWASTRFPAKPLALLRGRPLLQWTWEAARRVGADVRVVVATDDERIAAPARGWGAEVVMTSPDCPSGSDRCAEVVRALEAAGATGIDLVANVQGDEPFLDPATVAACIARLRRDPAAGVATPVVPLADDALFRSPHCVKAVPDAAGRALLFSRAPVPSDARTDAAERAAAWEPWLAEAGVALPTTTAAAAAGAGHDGPGLLGFQHVGLYVFRRDVLLRFTTMAPSRLERLEKLEQLRLLEAGIGIALVPTAGASIGIDTPDDLERAERLLAGVAGG